MDEFRGPIAVPRRAGDAHKASVGRVLVVGGSRGMAGAPALAALGALRAGAGLVNVAVPSTVQATVAAFRPEWMTTALGPDTATALGERSAEKVCAMAPNWDALVLGPGAGRRAGTKEAVRAIATRIETPLVLDADGLFGWDGQIDALASRRSDTVLTPHEGEAARLLDATAEKVHSDRDGAAEALARRTGAIVVLKGPQSLVCDGTRLYRNDSGNPVLAAGGTGDVLAGVCAALVAFARRSDADVFAAVCAAVHVHGLAGDWSARITGTTPRDRGVLASEIADAIPDALARMIAGGPA